MNKSMLSALLPLAVLAGCADTDTNETTGEAATQTPTTDGMGTMEGETMNPDGTMGTAPDGTTTTPATPGTMDDGTMMDETDTPDTMDETPTTPPTTPDPK